VENSVEYSVSIARLGPMFMIVGYRARHDH
jgi:hypothetical protein